MAYVINKGFDSEQAVADAFRVQKSDGYFWFSDSQNTRFVISAAMVHTIEWVES